MKHGVCRILAWQLKAVAGVVVRDRLSVMLGYSVKPQQLRAQCQVCLGHMAILHEYSSPFNMAIQTICWPDLLPSNGCHACKKATVLPCLRTSTLAFQLLDSSSLLRLCSSLVPEVTCWQSSKTAPWSCADSVATGGFADACQSYMRALEIREETPSAWDSLSMALVARGQFHLAELADRHELAALKHRLRSCELNATS